MSQGLRRTSVTVLLAVAAYCWWASGLPAFSWVAAVAVGLPAATVVIVSIGSRGRAHRAAWSVRGAGVVAWTTVIGASIVWELIQYRSAPRSSHPTLSVFADQLLEPRPMRAIAFAAWLACGWLLIR